MLRIIRIAHTPHPLRQEFWCLPQLKAGACSQNDLPVFSGARPGHGKARCTRNAVISARASRFSSQVCCRPDVHFQHAPPTLSLHAWSGCRALPSLMHVVVFLVKGRWAQDPKTPVQCQLQRTLGHPIFDWDWLWQRHIGDGKFLYFRSLLHCNKTSEPQTPN